MLGRTLMTIAFFSGFALAQHTGYPDCSILAKGSTVRAYAAPFDVMAPGRPKTLEKLKCGQGFTMVAQGNAGGSIWDKIETPKRKQAWVLNALVSPVPTALPQKPQKEHHRRARIANALQGAAAGAAIGQAVTPPTSPAPAAAALPQICLSLPAGSNGIYVTCH